ncbi:hypothetical protein BX600DRAFT_413882 [Xylariales sp. PMI_506]|nr:hypothetical protein BX600DRAFT_413882 [Xylariales sp. PMI_506]
MATSNPLERIAIVGATGHVGKFFTEALLQTGKHTITAITRAESKAALPAGVHRVEVNYDDHQSLVTSLRGQQFLIITIGVRAPRDSQSKLLKAAAEAGVCYVMPSYYGNDIRNPKLSEDALGAGILASFKEIENLGLTYIALVCGTWYEWSLALGNEWYGFDIKDRKAVFFDDGKTIITTSTWLQCGRALAALLSLPESGTNPSLLDWKNEPVYISSFRLSQRDMLDSFHRVLGTTDADWEITYESTEQRIKDGKEQFARGDFKGVAKQMYGLQFQRSRANELEYSRPVDNGRLSLPTEDLDEATKRAVDMGEGGWNL